MKVLDIRLSGSDWVVKNTHLIQLLADSGEISFKYISFY